MRLGAAPFPCVALERLACEKGYVAEQFSHTLGGGGSGNCAQNAQFAAAAAASGKLTVAAEAAWLCCKIQTARKASAVSKLAGQKRLAEGCKTL